MKNIVSLKNMFSVLIYMFVYTYIHICTCKRIIKGKISLSLTILHECVYLLMGWQLSPSRHGVFLKRVKLSLKHLQYKKSWCQYQVLLYVDSQTISCFISLFRRAIISRWDTNLGWGWQDKNQVSRNSHLGKVFHNEYLRNN